MKPKPDSDSDPDPDPDPVPDPDSDPDPDPDPDPDSDGGGGVWYLRRMRMHALVLVSSMGWMCGALGCSPSVAPKDRGGDASGAIPTGAIEGVLADGRTVRAVRDASGRVQVQPLPATTATTTAAPLPFLWPPIIDSHVHLAFWEVADELAKRGVLVAIDLGAPVATLPALREAPLDVYFAGPLVTRPGGYPLDGWGKDGYGLGCNSVACVDNAVADLAKSGASVIKLALGKNGLGPELVAPAVAAAHRAGMKVAAHALGDGEAALAAQAGCDVLAHTPVAPLSDATVQAWRGRAVISTLAAFGGSAVALDNLKRLRQAGATILYGTDLGNQRDAGPSDEELELLRKAGLDDAALTAAMTTEPARYWGLDGSEAGSADANGPRGAAGSLLVLAGDPRRSVRFLLAPKAMLLADPARSPLPRTPPR